MRILGFSKYWDKLKPCGYFTTFRVPRKDKDWEVGEVVQVVLNPRSKNRRILGKAVIIGKEKRYWNCIDNIEAKIDGFLSATEMKYWLKDSHKGINEGDGLLNRLTLNWKSKLT